MRCRPLLFFALTLSLFSATGCKTDPASLMTAVKADNTAEAIKLIGKGADPNIRTSPKGWSALHYAAMNGNVEIVQALLRAGADPNYAGTKDGQATTAARMPLDLAQGMLNVISGIQPSEIEAKLREAGLDDPVLLKSAKDPNAVDRYEKIIVLLIKSMKDK
ncbi:MAG: ankyrin repeat domain-containing protein [Terracidiphilus sp.]|jgi:ankyrin repeat protein